MYFVVALSLAQIKTNLHSKNINWRCLEYPKKILDSTKSPTLNSQELQKITDLPLIIKLTTTGK
jgi:hypothetical protein